MFSRRKRIVIGETYLFDVLNQTDMACKTSLVTVVEKKRNKYTVLSVNNGDLFECEAKYLTPYLKDTENYIVRCKYGVTDFDKRDVEYFNLCDKLLDMAVAALTSPEKDDDIIKHIIESVSVFKLLTEGLREKVSLYYEMSAFKKHIATIRNIGKEADVVKPETETPDYSSLEILDEFNEMFNDITYYYKHGNINEEEFIETACSAIEEHFPLEVLKKESKESVHKYAALTAAIIKATVDGNIVFVITHDIKEGCNKVLPLTAENDPVSILNVTKEITEFLWTVIPDLKAGKEMVHSNVEVIPLVVKRGII